MNNEQREKLVSLAREDEEFFHALVFNPQQIAKKLDFLGEEERQSLGRLDPARLIAVLVGGANPFTDCGVTNTCTYTCQVTNSVFDQPGKLSA